jgi:fructose-bisphosphate aldolase, class II
MVFASTIKILRKAHLGNYALGHFNINNMEIVQGVVRAAEKLKSPVILATSEGAIKYAGMEYLYCLASTAAVRSKVPIAFHLDHGRDLGVIKKAINMGYSSVMFDGSHLDFERNIKITKRIVQLAHRRGISVEAELGTIGGKEDTIEAKEIIYTSPEKAKAFVERTGCDFLAVAIGTSHGAYKFRGKADLRHDLLRKINLSVKIPLVLHGASGVPKNVVRQAEKYGAKLSGVYGVPNNEIKKAIRNGINKFNTDTDIRLAFDAAVRKFLKEKPHDFDPRHILGPARDAIQSVAEERIKVFGSARKC